MTARKADVMDAITLGDAGLVHTLLCGGLDPNKVYNGQTALMYACELGHTPVVETLVLNGAHIDTADRYGRTALHFAARFGHIECVKLLISVNARDDLEAFLLGGEKPVDFARAKGHLEIVKLLMYGQKALRPAKVDAVERPHNEANVMAGNRSIAAGGAVGATFSGSYKEGVDAHPTPCPPPFAVQPTPMKDESKRLAPQPRYGY